MEDNLAVNIPSRFCGFDADDVFAYPTAKYVRIRDARLGLLRFVSFFLILVYVVVYSVRHPFALVVLVVVVSRFSDGLAPPLEPIRFSSPTTTSSGTTRWAPFASASRSRPSRSSPTAPCVRGSATPVRNHVRYFAPRSSRRRRRRIFL
jgi:hypothetical protein